MASSTALALGVFRTRVGPSITLSSTVLWAKRLKDWKTIPTSARSAASAEPSCGSSLPSNTIRPESIVSSRLTQRHSVDLPEPEAPRMTTTSPSWTSRSTSRSATKSPNRLFTDSTLSNTLPERALVLSSSSTMGKKIGPYTAKS